MQMHPGWPGRGVAVIGLNIEIRSWLLYDSAAVGPHAHAYGSYGWMTWMHKWLWHGDFEKGSLLAASILPTSSECCCKF